MPSLANNGGTLYLRNMFAFRTDEYSQPAVTHKGS